MCADQQRVVLVLLLLCVYGLDGLNHALRCYKLYDIKISQGGSGGSRPPQENVRKKGDFTPYPRTCVPFSGTGPKNAKINP